MDSNLVYPYNEDIKLGDKCEKGSQIRPNVVWFGENLSAELLKKAYELVIDADYVVIVGTSLNVFPSYSLMTFAKEGATVYYVDPSDGDTIPMSFINSKGKLFRHIKEKATVGLTSSIE